MRKLGLSALICGMVMVPYAALSQESSAPTADDYVCALTGECGDEDAPDANATQSEDGARVSATRGFSMSGPATTSRPAPKASASQNRRQTASRPTQRPNRPVAQQPGRVDLRLAFATGSSTLSAAGQAQIQAFAEALKRPQLAASRIRIEGHTDSSGGRSLNLDLSEKRAQAVAEYLVSQGIGRDRLDVRGYGYDRPLPGRPASAAANRRVEAVRIQ